MPLAFWRKLTPKRKSKLLKAMKGRGLFLITKLQKKQIGMLAEQMNIPTRRLFEHFQELRKKGIRDLDIGDKMLQDLSEMRDLMQETNLHSGKIKQALQYRSLASIIEEMRQHAEQMQAAQQGQAAA
tara:strand:+ start:293 stop:673 length:381 start_codon:yes stop_codon:yes gene_type:complete